MLTYNTLSRKKEEFMPLKDKLVRMYVCGVTPYDEVHLGHARAYVTFDIIRRHFENTGFEVKHIQNFTDVDDKIINRAKETDILPSALAQKYIDSYFLEMDKLNIKRAAEYPRVTRNIPQIVEFVKLLIDKDYAYITEDGVYFSINKFPAYGKLSKRNLDELKSGARVEVDEKKNNPLDFALWKKTKQDEPEEVSWDSPWGKGRPGWHIECSVMSTNILGETFDIHGGGQDLIFPHHENELAQSEAATGKPFARYWIHNGFVTINKEKMSKSLGNFFTLKDIFKKYEPRVVRYFLLSQHYRMPLDFSEEALKQAKATLDELDSTYNKIKIKNIDLKAGYLEDVLSEFYSCLDDDFNTEKALSVMHILKNSILNNLYKADILWISKAHNTFVKMIEPSLGIKIQNNGYTREVKEKIEKREKARLEKNWAEADKQKKELLEMGAVFVIDTPEGKSISSASPDSPIFVRADKANE
ncbi:MAG: cysteine--tRNA ligase [Elusimicrobia bacterium]|nr:cysteine--tRNA ligase [Candidatus Liberimonas magnetica]